MGNISEIPYKERGFAIAVKNLVRQVTSSRMGMFRSKSKGSKSLRKFANIRCIEAKEVKRTKQKGPTSKFQD